MRLCLVARAWEQAIPLQYATGQSAERSCSRNYRDREYFNEYERSLLIAMVAQFLELIPTADGRSSRKRYVPPYGLMMVKPARGTQLKRIVDRSLLSKRNVNLSVTSCHHQFNGDPVQLVPTSLYLPRFNSGFGFGSGLSMRVASQQVGNTADHHQHPKSRLHSQIYQDGEGRQCASMYQVI